ncbi:hypothetical protein [Synechococcus elongatus]|uniref:PH domain-containing protein n=1 Tax=Synechococcus elongatus PCC 11801 TaxID=2219813 RepID=A0AAN1QPQ5_SYNEL|nr:hypothetical protein [Synechococcus elongatus]AZB73160.1 hypothetical protein DOP62_10930 [Synechococcus elongatus PCC 11801]
MTTDALPEQRIYRISPLIRVTLLLLYLALTSPLASLAEVTAAPISPQLLKVGLAIGFVLVYAALSEQVEISPEGIQVRYPAWCRWFLRRQWQLPWDAIARIQPRSTGQGGLVYYLIDRQGQGYLLPMRIAGFAELTRILQARTTIDMRDVRPLSQPWMYLILLVLTLLLLLIDAWVVWVAMPDFADVIASSLSASAQLG